MNILIIVIFAMWLASAISIAPYVAPFTNELGFFSQLIVCLVVCLGAPFMLISQAIETILDCFLPGGWNDDEDKYGY